jgi:hypothetical protein
VLVRLDAVSGGDLEMLIEEAWRGQAPAALASDRRVEYEVG